MKTTVFTTAIVLMAFFLFVGAKVMKHSNPHAQLQDQVLQYPENIKTIIDNKCFGCHNPEARSEEAREALNWEELPGLTKARQVATLDEIIQVLEEGIMPPRKMVEMNPDAAITDEQVQALKGWAETTADKLLQ